MDIGEYMAEIEKGFSDLTVRVAALENLVTQLPGVSMERDPSRLPVVVIENTVGSLA